MLSKAGRVLRSRSRVLMSSLRASREARALVPTNAIVFVTYRCTSRCVGCNIWQGSGSQEGELSPEEWVQVLEKLAAAGVRQVELFGGDALLRRDALLPMIRFCRERGIQTFFTTNSLGMTQETTRAIVEAGLSVLYISLDEVPEINGAVRGIERHFERASRVIGWARESRKGAAGTRLECVTTVSALNWRFIPRLLEFSRDHGVDCHHLRAMSEFTAANVAGSAVDGVLPDPYFMSTDGASRRFSPEDARELRALLSHIEANSRDYAPLSINMETLESIDEGSLVNLRYPHQACHFCTNGVVLSPSGDVLPCVYFRQYRMGNLRETPLATAWGGDRHRLFVERQRTHRIPLCDECSMKTVHRGFAATLRNELKRVVRRLRSH